MIRCSFMVGLGLVTSAPWVSAQQFGETRTVPVPTQPTPAPVAPAVKPAPAPGTLPSFPTTPVMPATKPRPVPIVQETPHEWAIQPNHGEWMVCVKSYTGPKSKELAIELCDQIRRTHRAAAYLYDRNYDERMREEIRKAEYRAARELELAPFLQIQAEVKQKTIAAGGEYIDMPVKIRTPVVRIEEQWAVLVGGFKDLDTASQALAQIRKWPPPTGNHLMDNVVMQRPSENGKPPTVEATHLNPYANALSVPNPSIKKATSTTVPIDPTLVKFNEEEPLSVLKNPKPWTLIVKDFMIPLSVQSSEQEGGVIGRIFGANNDPATMLEATAKQARELAKALRDPSMQQSAAAAARRLGMQPRALESYVLHVRTGSRVTVGSFSGPDDPALLEMQRLLANMSFKVEKPGEGGQKFIEEVRLFDGITPMPVPRVR